MKKITKSNCEVIAPFVDKGSGKTIAAGGEIPKHLLKDQEALQRLVKARCLKVAGGKASPAKAPAPPPPAPSSGSAAGSTAPASQSASAQAQGSGQGSSQGSGQEDGQS